MARVARSADELTSDFFADVFASAPGRLASVSLEPVGTGQVGSTLRAQLEWVDGDGQPPSVIVKMASVVADGRDVDRRAATHRREVGFYRDVAPGRDLPVPRCHFAEVDDDGAFTLVLDEAPGIVGDQLHGCTPAVAESIVDAASALHSSTWGLPDGVGEQPWMVPAATRESEAARRQTRYSELLDGFLEHYRHRLDAGCLEVARRLDGKVARIDTGLRLEACVVHNDFRLDNMMIHERAGGTDVCVVDWQTTGIGSGSVDLAYALGSGLPTEVRRGRETVLVDRYLTALARRGVVVDADAAVHDYRLGSASGLVMAVVASQVVRRTARGDEMFAVMAERHARQMIDLEFFDIVEVVS